MRVSDRRIAEWWEAPGIDGREAFDEEILFLNASMEGIALPRWAVLVRDRMPRWGFEPCSHRFLEGLEQVLGMIGSGRVVPRFGGCGDIPLSVQRKLDQIGSALLKWAEGENGGASLEALGGRAAERVEAARAVGDVVLAVGRGPAALDGVVEQWGEGARFPLTRSLVEGDEAPLTALAHHPCAYNTLWSIDRLVHCIGNGGDPGVLTCNTSLRMAATLDPGRIPTLRATAEAIAHWLEGQNPRDCLEERVRALIGARDEVRHWLVASLYKTLKLWQLQLDCILGERREYLSLI